MKNRKTKWQIAADSQIVVHVNLIIETGKSDRNWDRRLRIDRWNWQTGKQTYGQTRGSTYDEEYSDKTNNDTAIRQTFWDKQLRTKWTKNITDWLKWRHIKPYWHSQTWRWLRKHVDADVTDWQHKDKILTKTDRLAKLIESWKHIYWQKDWLTYLNWQDRLNNWQADWPVEKWVTV